MFSKHALTALLFASLLFSPNHAAEPANTINLRVLSYNVWMVPIQGKRSVERAQIIGPRLRCFDLVFLQEAFGDKSKQRILGGAGPKFSSRYRGEKETLLDSGAITLTKNCITKCSFRKFSTCRGPQCHSGRGILYVQIRLPNGILLDTFNVHLQAMEPDADIRCSQLRDLLSMIECKNDGCNPVLVAGDFNIIGENPEYYCLREKLCGYRDAWTEINPSCAGYTWDPVKNDWGDEDHDESRKSQRLDYIFVRDGHCASWAIQCSNVEFNHKVNTGRRRLFKSACIFPSDHFGVGAQLQLQPTLAAATVSVDQASE